MAGATGRRTEGEPERVDRLRVDWGQNAQQSEQGEQTEPEGGRWGEASGTRGTGSLAPLL
jgi:hypothetical protein